VRVCVCVCVREEGGNASDEREESASSNIRVRGVKGISFLLSLSPVAFSL